MRRWHENVRLLRFAILAQLAISINRVPAQSPSNALNSSVVSISTFWSENGVRPGEEITLAFVLDIGPHYHINSHLTKQPYVALDIHPVNLPSNIRAHNPNYPEPTVISLGASSVTEKISTFSNRITVLMSFATEKSLAPGQVQIPIQIQYQACDNQRCLFPTTLTENVVLHVLEPASKISHINDHIFFAQIHQSRLNISFFGYDFLLNPSRIWIVWLVAAIGGALLNFTPCVLPMVPIKIMGLSRSAQNRRWSLLLGLVMGVGVVFFWLALAVAITVVRGFDAANKLFQFPAFTIIVGIFICAMALGMCGVFSVVLPTWIYRINPGQGSLLGSFGFGVMTAVLSTPCTAPFMGAAAAWAATQAPAITLSTFSAIGFGMALPYITLSAIPSLVGRMPRSGPSAELVKQVMGLLLFAAGTYFLGTGLVVVLSRPSNAPSLLYWWFVALFIILAGGWLIWRTFQLTSKGRFRLLFGSIGFLFIAVGSIAGVKLTRGSPIHWSYYTPDRFAEAQKKNRVIVMEFSAAWCLNCQALEQSVLYDKRVVKLLNAPNIAPIKVDLTANNVSGSKKLLEVGRLTIPYLVVFAADGREIFSGDAYTVEQLINALNAANANAE